jgi:Holliday junction resolvase RusA-like endonuclease
MIAAHGRVHIEGVLRGLSVQISDIPTPAQPRQNRLTRWGVGRNAEKAKDYNAWLGGMRTTLGVLMAGHERLQGPVAATLLWESPLAVEKQGDLDSLQKSALDACRSIIIPDDRWVVRITASKEQGTLTMATWTFREVS